MIELVKVLEFCRNSIIFCKIFIQNIKIGSVGSYRQFAFPLNYHWTFEPGLTNPRVNTSSTSTHPSHDPGPGLQTPADNMTSGWRKLTVFLSFLTQFRQFPDIQNIFLTKLLSVELDESPDNEVVLIAPDISCR